MSLPMDVWTIFRPTLGSSMALAFTQMGKAACRTSRPARLVGTTVATSLKLALFWASRLRCPLLLSHLYTVR